MFGWFSKKKQTQVPAPRPQALAPAPYFQRPPPYDPSQPQPEQRLHWPPAHPADYVTPMARIAPTPEPDEAVSPAPVQVAATVPIVMEPLPASSEPEPSPVKLLPLLPWPQRLERARELWPKLLQTMALEIDTRQDTDGESFHHDFFAYSMFLDLPIEGGVSVQPNYGAWFTQALADRFDISAYRLLMLDKMEQDRATGGNFYPKGIDQYLEEFEVHRVRYLNGAIALMSSMEDSVDVAMTFYEEANARHQALPWDTDPMTALEQWAAYAKTLVAHIPVLRDSRWFDADCPEHLHSLVFHSHAEACTGFVSELPQRCTERAIEAMKKEIASVSAGRASLSTAADGVAFEQHLRALVLESFQDAVIHTTPVSGDQGADLLVRLGSVLVAIQAKRYTGVVGNAAVQEIFSAKQFYDADFAMVVTTSRYTQPAQVLAAKLDVALATEDDFIRQIRHLLM